MEESLIDDLEQRAPAPLFAPSSPLIPSLSFRQKHSFTAFLITATASLGVVFGDLGTSPMYSFREAFAAGEDVPINVDNVIGVLSMIVWSLLLVVTLKYSVFLMTFPSSSGNGGTMALLERLLGIFPRHNAVASLFLMPVAMVAMSLFIADSFITPGISVLAAVEGLSSMQPALAPYTVYAAIVLLLALFYAQRFGTERLGGVFGPIMAAYFLTIGAMGLVTLLLRGNWQVMKAMNPLHIVWFAHRSPWGFYVALQSTLLSICGAEALYADMGHFGRGPIILAWHAIVLPCLLLNYFGQGSLLLSDAPLELKVHPFFSLAPTYGSRLWLLLVSTLATLIGSQSVISGAFSVVSQAIALDMLPKLRIVRTHGGQIFIPAMNAILAAGVLSLVALFRHSSRLASAYGMAVCGAMICDSFFLFWALRFLSNWNFFLALIPAVFFMLMDAVFVTGSFSKVLVGGWIPVTLASVVFFIISVWVSGRRALLVARTSEDQRLPVFTLRNVERRLRGTGVFFSRQSEVVPYVMDVMYKQLGQIHERNILVKVCFDEAEGDEEHQWNAHDYGYNFYEVVVHVPWRPVEESEERQWDLVQRINSQLAHPLLVGETVFYRFFEMPVPRFKSSFSNARVLLFRILLTIGRGSFEELLGKHVHSKSIQIVRQVPI